MAFRFLDLPLELRTKVYRCLFFNGGVAVYASGALCPEQTSNQDRILIFAESIALLRVCSQTHSEGTVILYGSNTFYFDDCCRDCTRYSECCCPKRSQITYLYSWLHSIGNNRMKLKKLQISIQNPCLLVSAAERGYETEVGDGEFSYDGSYLGKAFDLLSLNHSLQKLELDICIAEDLVQEFLDRRGMNSILLQKMSKIRGLQELRVTPLPVTAVGLDRLAKLKSIMEKGGSAEPNPQASISRFTTIGPVSTKEVAKRIVVLAEERESCKTTSPGRINGSWN